MNKKLYYKEYLYPEMFQKYKRKIVYTILSLSAIIAFIINGIIIIITIKSAMAIVIYCLAIFLLLYVPIPIYASIFQELYYINTYPSRGLQQIGKVVINRNEIKICLRKKCVKCIKWSDVAMIEKYRENDEVLIIIMTPNIYNKVQKDDRYKNYIEIPARNTLENAIRSYSGLKITLRKEEF